LSNAKSQSVTAIILSFKRPQNLERICTNLRKSGIVSEIIIWNNNPDLTIKSKRDVVINSSKNFKPFTRYAAVMLASNDTIIFQDDDLLCSPKDVVALHSEFTRNENRIYGFFGRNLENSKLIPNVDFYGEVDIVLGRFTLFSKNLLSKVYGDYLKLGPIERGDDIAFSLLTGQKHFCMKTTVLELDPQHKVGLASEPDHIKKRQEMIDRILLLRAHKNTS